MANDKAEGFTVVSETISPPLSAIIEVLNKRALICTLNIYLRNWVKYSETGGSTTAGIEVVKEFLDDSGIKTEGIFMEDGSGLSSRDAVNSAAMVRFLII